MATSTNRRPTQPADCALYAIHRVTGATLEIFYADRARAQAFGVRGAGWFWRERGSRDVPSGPFLVCLDAYCEAMAVAQHKRTQHIDDRE